MFVNHLETDATLLQRRLRALRADPAVSASRKVRAFEMWFRQARREGQDVDAAPTRPRAGERPPLTFVQ